MVTFGKCCNPIPGDEMIGFLTRGRGITVHHSSCKSLPLLNEESDRLMPVEWDVARSDIFNVRLKIESLDRKGMLKEITEVISGGEYQYNQRGHESERRIINRIFHRAGE
ncbi:MAG: hypothetical protein CM1200mP10_13400 [Candidatus Neomarinimicrobiota bacterium]|nr:MAG: hypothetical protein CM1200mP10_13400 [Candidatus Neomarinimicrobiota bacterium]